MHCGRSGTESYRVSHNAFRVTTGNREHGVKWHKTSSRLWGRKKSDEKPHAAIGLKVHTRLYRWGGGGGSAQRYWDYSKPQPKEPRWNVIHLTARLRRPPRIWTLRMAATDWALSRRTNAKEPSAAYSTQLHKRAVEHAGESATAAMCALNSLSPVYGFYML